MLTLDRVVRRSSHDTHRIELPFAGLQRIGFGLARAQLGLVAAGPGVGKSAFALQIALRSQLRTYYASADTDSWTMTIRAIANISGHPQSYVTQVLEGGYVVDEIDAAVWLSQHVHFAFDTYSTREINDDLLAYAVVHGAFPDLVIVDNVRNFARDGDSELAGQQRVMDQLHAIAVSTGAHVLALHHAQGQYHDGDRPVPLSGIENKITHLPAQVLTLHQAPPYVFACPVKNRLGRADPSAKTLQVRLRFDGDRQTFTDPTE